MDRVRGSLPALAVAAAVSACSYSSSDSAVLPWLKRTDATSSFGSLGGSRKTVYSTRVLLFFWHELDAWAITVLDADTVLVRGDHGEALLRRGELTPTPACPALPQGSVQLPPSAAGVAFDCVTLGGHGESGRVNAVRFWRLRTDGTASLDVAVAAAGAGQVLLHPTAQFYDRKAQPYFISIAARAAPDSRAPDPDCALVVVENAGTRLLHPPAPLGTANDCSRKDVWEGVAGTALLTTNEIERELAASPSGPRRR